MHKDVLPGMTKLNEEELTMLIDKSIEMDNLFKGKEGMEKLASFQRDGPVLDEGYS